MSRKERVSITSMAFKGYGVARVEGQVVFTPYTVTGDDAQIEIVENKKNYSLGRLVTVFAPSPWRTDPPCPYFGTCGGCQWQHIEGSKQVEIKRDILNDVLRRLGGIKDIPPASLIPSPRLYGYRARIQLKVTEKALGYYRPGSHQIVDIDHCPISHPLINRIISILREERSFFSSVQEIEIRISPDEERGSLILQSYSFPPEIRDLARGLLQRYSILKGIAITGKENSLYLGDPLLTFSVSFDRHGETRKLMLRASPQSFFQVNPEQNQALVRTVLDFGEVKADERVLDLYAGIGNLSLPLASRAREVIGVEENPVAVEDARFNARENRINRCDFLSGKAEEVLKDWTKGKPDLLVLDPPRAGGKKTVGLVAGLGAKRILYVSCDPATLSRDLRLFAEAGYPLQRLCLIDLFPQTYHMEVVALLRRETVAY